MILILSGRYVNDEMAAELGKIPPTFLPLGNKRLYQHQLELISPLNRKILFSLPKGFDIPQHDLKILQGHNVELIELSPTLTLGESILFLLGAIEEKEELSILFGDTLFESVQSPVDSFSVGIHDEAYPWGVARKDGDGYKFINGVEVTEVDSHVLSGYFNFSNVSVLKECLEHAQGDFFHALTEYDRSINLSHVALSGWLDFGHLHTYFQSKAKKTTERAFNSLEIVDRKVIKKSSKNDKIFAEANWFESLPGELKIYCPVFLWRKIENDIVSYATEYLYLSTLSELFVYGKLPVKVWKRIFASSTEFLRCAAIIKPDYDVAREVESLFVQKNLSRLNDIDFGDRFSVYKPVIVNGKQYLSVVDLMHSLIERIEFSDQYYGCIHGDFCFSNIMYDFRTNSVKVIDPRGINNEGEATIYGDVRYDLAKYYHSIVGFYDLIVTGRYSLIEHDKKNEFTFDISPSNDQIAIRDVFLDSDFAKDIGNKDVYILMILLFISMVPLHTEDECRQLALILNAYRLYEDLLKGI